MKINNVSKMSSLIICLIIIMIVPTTVVDYVRVRSGREPIFCLSKEIKSDNNTTSLTCKSFIYKYYETKSNNYINKRFIPLWKELDGTYE